MQERADAVRPAPWPRVWGPLSPLGGGVASSSGSLSHRAGPRSLNSGPRKRKLSEPLSEITTQGDGTWGATETGLGQILPLRERLSRRGASVPHCAAGNYDGTWRTRHQGEVARSCPRAMYRGAFVTRTRVNTRELGAMAAGDQGHLFSACSNHGLLGTPVGL